MKMRLFFGGPAMSLIGGVCDIKGMAALLQGDMDGCDAELITLDVCPVLICKKRRYCCPTRRFWHC